MEFVFLIYFEFLFLMQYDKLFIRSIGLYYTYLNWFIYNYTLIYKKKHCFANRFQNNVVYSVSKQNATKISIVQTILILDITKTESRSKDCEIFIRQSISIHCIKTYKILNQELSNLFFCYMLCYFSVKIISLAKVKILSTFCHTQR